MDYKQYDKLINDKLRKYTLAYAKKTNKYYPFWNRTR